MKLNIKFLITYGSLCYLLALSNSAASREVQEMLDEMTGAAKLSVITIKDVGVNGLVKKINSCYSRSPKHKDQYYFCIYLDFSGRYIDQNAAKLLPISPEPYFQKTQFEFRINSVLAKMGWDMNGVPIYMENTELVMGKLVDKEVQRAVQK